MSTEKSTLEVDLDAILAKLDRNFIKGNAWYATTTKRGYYITDLHHKLSFTFSAEQKLVLKSYKRSST